MSFKARNKPQPGSLEPKKENVGAGLFRLCVGTRRGGGRGQRLVGEQQLERGERERRWRNAPLGLTIYFKSKKLWVPSSR